ncbi:MAG: molybdenum cofactor cytidylyltransferase [Firmicutes bacterium]|nr:molybdenum cofactor cytidylyltransferase [Bacillota bacterium]
MSGVIMASGFSKRMGREKLTLDVFGLPLVERVIKEVVKSNIDEIIVIYRNEEVKNIAKKYNLKTYKNNKAYLGQSESIKLGVNNADPNTEGFAFFVADQPFITYEIINRVIKVFNNNKSHIVIPMYNGKKGNPVIFPSLYRSKLKSLKGDTGGRKLIKNNKNISYVNIKNKLKGIDIDTLKEYETLTKEENNGI